MSDLSKRELLKRGKEMEKKEEKEVPKEIKSIDEALREKEIRETQNLKIRLEQDRLCAEMKNMEQIASILNSTSDAQAGCPMNREEEAYHPVTCEGHGHVENKVVENEEIHPVGCHCEKCCPNPKPNFFQRHRNALLISVLWLAMIILAVGWSPSGEIAEAINKSWVELFVDFFKVAIFAVAGVVTYTLTKKKDE